MMAVRLLEMQHLKPTGSIWLHCDPAASHYLKTMMDCIFGSGSVHGRRHVEAVRAAQRLEIGCRVSSRISLYYSKDLARRRSLARRKSFRAKRRKSGSRTSSRIPVDSISTSPSISRRTSPARASISNDSRPNGHVARSAGGGLKEIDERLAENRTLIHWTGSGEAALQEVRREYAGDLPATSGRHQVSLVERQREDRLSNAKAAGAATANHHRKLERGGRRLRSVLRLRHEACSGRIHLGREWVGCDLSRWPA